MVRFGFQNINEDAKFLPTNIPDTACIKCKNPKPGPADEAPATEVIMAAVSSGVS